MASAADQALLVYTRLAQLAFVYIKALSVSDWSRASTALVAFNQGLAARRATVEARAAALTRGGALSPAQSAAFAHVGAADGFLVNETPYVLRAVLTIWMPDQGFDITQTMPETLPELVAWAPSFVRFVLGDPEIAYGLTEMDDDTAGTPVAVLPGVLLAYLQRPLGTVDAGAAPPVVPRVTPGYVTPGRTTPRTTGCTADSQCPPGTACAMGQCVESFGVTGGRSKVSPWIIGALVVGVGGAAVYLLSGLVVKRGRK